MFSIIAIIIILMCIVINADQILYDVLFLLFIGCEMVSHCVIIAMNVSDKRAAKDRCVNYSKTAD